MEYVRRLLNQKQPGFSVALELVPQTRNQVIYDWLDPFLGAR